VRSLVAHSLRDCKDKRALFPVQAFLRNIFKKNAQTKMALKIKFGEHPVYRIKITKDGLNKTPKGAKQQV